MSSSADSNSSIEANQNPEDSEVCCHYVLTLIKKLMLKRLNYVL